jgi:prephenate dehydrogenase
MINNLIKSFKNFLSKIIRRDTNESSKRFIALWTMSLLTYAVLRYTKHDNVVSIISALATFILALLGVAVWEQVELNSNKNKKEDELE